MNKEDNAVLFARVDREDFWVTGMAFRTNVTDTYEAAYNDLKAKLESPEVVERVIESHSLKSDLFSDEDSGKEDETYKFKGTHWAYALVYEFENEDGDVKEFKLRADFIYVVD